MPFRKLGLFGTPDNPIYFKAGESVPIYLEARILFPFNIKKNGLRFAHDAETYFENGVQVVRPLYRKVSYIVWGKGNGVLFGAPTDWYTIPRYKPVVREGVQLSPA